MLVGTPAIVTDLPVNREISKSSALFLPKISGASKHATKHATQSSLESALSGMIKLLKDPRARKRILAAQKKAAQRYSWEKSVKIFLRTLRTLNSFRRHE